jgi:hypothetical protein
LLFGGDDGIRYAVNPQGHLLLFRNSQQNGTGDVANASVIGHGGWQRFGFLFGGGDEILCAARPQQRGTEVMVGAPWT